MNPDDIEAAIEQLKIRREDQLKQLRNLQSVIQEHGLTDFGFSPNDIGILQGVIVATQATDLLIQVSLLKMSQMDERLARIEERLLLP